MKNAFKILILFTIICYGCDPELTNYNDGDWFIHNATGQDILLKTPSSIRDIKNEETIYLVTFEFNAKQNVIPYFDKLYKTWDEDVPIIIEVYSKNGDLLTSWSLSEKDEAGKQFFNESSWEKSESISDDRYKNVTIKWTFNIEPEDIN